MAHNQHLVFTKGCFPTTTFDALKLETILPLSSEQVFELLKIKPVNDWGKMFDILHERHLVLLPRASDVPVVNPIKPVINLEHHLSTDSTGKVQDKTEPAIYADPTYSKVLSSAIKANHLKAQTLRVSQQQAAKKASKERRQAAHLELQTAQVKAAKARKAARLLEHQKREAAAKNRRQHAAKDVANFDTLKRPADVVHHARYLRSQAAHQLGNLTSRGVATCETALSSIPMPIGSFGAPRVPRKLLAKFECTGIEFGPDALPIVNNYIARLNRLDQRLSQIFGPRDSKRVARPPKAPMVSVQAAPIVDAEGFTLVQPRIKNHKKQK